MIIGVAGPYSAASEEEREANLNRLNNAAAELLALGHVPIVGVNAALPVVNKYPQNPYPDIMRISMAVLQVCEGLLFLAESPGANREREYMISKGLPVYYSIAEILDNPSN